MKQRRQPAVYLVTDGEYVKIGLGSTDMRAIVSRIEEYNPRKIAVIAIIDGHREVHKVLQAEFKKQRLRSDWYQISVQEAFKIVQKHNFKIVNQPE